MLSVAAAPPTLISAVTYAALLTREYGSVTTPVATNTTALGEKFFCKQLAQIGPSWYVNQLNYSLPTFPNPVDFLVHSAVHFHYSYIWPDDFFSFHPIDQLHAILNAGLVFIPQYSSWRRRNRISNSRRFTHQTTKKTKIILWILLISSLMAKIHVPSDAQVHTRNLPDAEIHIKHMKTKTIHIQTKRKTNKFSWTAFIIKIRMTMKIFMIASLLMRSSLLMRASLIYQILDYCYFDLNELAETIQTFIPHVRSLVL